MLEAAVVIGLDGNPIHWHLPRNRSAVHLPDSRDLWAVLWENRNNLLGVAHSHPGVRAPTPSFEDLSTFSACELALDQRLLWWIISERHLRTFVWEGPEKYNYIQVIDSETNYHTDWVQELNRVSYAD